VPLGAGQPESLDDFGRVGSREAGSTLLGGGYATSGGGGGLLWQDPPAPWMAPEGDEMDAARSSP